MLIFLEFFVYFNFTSINQFGFFSETYSLSLSVLVAVVVFNLGKEGNISKALSGEKIGTLIDGSGIGNQMV